MTLTLNKLHIIKYWLTGFPFNFNIPFKILHNKLDSIYSMKITGSKHPGKSIVSASNNVFLHFSFLLKKKFLQENPSNTRSGSNKKTKKKNLLAMKVNKVRIVNRCITELKDRNTTKVKPSTSPGSADSEVGFLFKKIFFFAF